MVLHGVCQQLKTLQLHVQEVLLLVSNVFRVEKIEGNCCTFRVLADNTDETSVYPYVATNVFFTMDCDCLCCIRCLSDTYVDCLC